MAKAFVGDAGIDLVQTCFQVYGGIGYTWEHDQHLYLRRITTDAELLRRRRLAPRARLPASRDLREDDEMTETIETTTIDVDSFRDQAREWIRANLAPRPADAGREARRDRTAEDISAARALQRKLFDAGFAGITYPAEYGGRGLTAAHERAFREEAAELRDARPRRRRRRDVRSDRPLAAGPLDARVPRAAHPQDPLRRGDLVPVLLRARGRLGPRRDPHAGHPRRRPLDPQRVEDLELRRVLRRLGDVPGAHRLGRAEAPRPHVVRRADRRARRRRFARSPRSTATPSSARSSSTRWSSPTPT